jgi:hypothetical protein
LQFNKIIIIIIINNTGGIERRFAVLSLLSNIAWPSHTNIPIGTSKCLCVRNLKNAKRSSSPCTPEGEVVVWIQVLTSVIDEGEVNEIFSGTLALGFIEPLTVPGIFLGINLTDICKSGV